MSSSPPASTQPGQPAPFRWSGRWVEVCIGLVAWLFALVVVLPALGIAVQAWQGMQNGAGSVAGMRLLPLLGNTVTLAAAAGVLAVCIGLVGAWVVSRYHFAGRSLAVILLASPLAVPPYVVAQFWLEVTGPGSAGSLLRSGFDASRLLVAALIIGLCTSPLCFLILRAAVQRLDTTREDAAATLGVGPMGRVFRLVLPSLRPAWAAGLCLVALYACADFGVVESLGVRTFTQAIFFEQTLLEQDRALAWGRSAILALALLMLAVPLYLTERATRGKARYEQQRSRSVRVQTLGAAGTLGIWSLVFLVSGPTSLLVFGRCVYLLTGLEDVSRVWSNAFTALGNSLIWACMAATLGVVFAAILSWVAARYRSTVHQALVPLASIGYVLPGPVVALGALIVVTGWIPQWMGLYGTAGVLIFAYVVRYLPEALQASESGMAQVPRVLEEAARTLGRGPLGAFFHVTVPVLSGSLVAGWVFMFSASMRELPATLMLKPLGSRTLSTEIWQSAQDSFYTDMAPATLLLLLSSTPAVLWLLLQRRSM